jgi:hypothetical protein
MSDTDKQPRKPQTPREWALYRAVSSCQIGRARMNEGETAGTKSTPQDHAIYCLLHAVEDLATAMQEGGAK